MEKIKLYGVKVAKKKNRCEEKNQLRMRWEVKVERCLGREKIWEESKRKKWERVGKM